MIQAFYQVLQLSVSLGKTLSVPELQSIKDPAVDYDSRSVVRSTEQGRCDLLIAMLVITSILHGMVALIMMLVQQQPNVQESPFHVAV